jgi:hypothetical protein
MATFITSRTTGQTINITVTTDSGYWKYNHDGTDSSVFGNGNQTVTITNVDGEFTLISCLLDGTPSGDITELNLSSNQLTSFDGTGLTSLTILVLNSNQLTSFDGTGLTSLTFLNLSFTQLTSFDGTDLTSVTNLSLNNNQLTSFDGTPLTSLASLDLSSNQLTSFDGTPLTSLIVLNLFNNQLTSFDGTPLTSLSILVLNSNQLTSIDLSVLTNLQYLYLNGNPSINTTTINNEVLSLLAANELSNGWNGGTFYTTGGRTILSTTDYDYLISTNWDLQGLDLISSPTKYLVDNINNPSSEQIIYGILTLPNLPTTDPNVLGQLWVDTANNNVLKVSQG